MDFLTHPIDTTPALYTHVDPYLDDVLLMTIDELKAESAELDRLCWTEEVYTDKPRLETLKKRRQVVERRTRQLSYKVEPIIRDPKRRALFEYEVLTRYQIMQRFPNIIAHIICESLGYATPSHAAGILQTALLGDPDYCEWIDACYHCDGRSQSAMPSRDATGITVTWHRSNRPACSSSEQSKTIKSQFSQVGSNGHPLDSPDGWPQCLA